MKSKGFTLLEMMIVVAIVALLASIAVPGFTQYLRKSKRADAMVSLKSVQQAQAKLRGNCRWYGETLVGAIPSGKVACQNTAAATYVNIPGAIAGGTVGGASATILSENSLYTTYIEPDSATGNAYTAIAEAQGSQASDAECYKFVLYVNTPDVNDRKDPNGLRRSIAKDGTESADDKCWH